MKKIVEYLIKIIHYLYNPNLRERIIVFQDKLYSIYISNSFFKAGNQLFIKKPITLVGGSQMEIGKNVSIGRYSIITAFTKRRNQSFSSQIIIGNNCNIGDYNHITCVNKIIIGNGVLTGRWVTITDNSHGESKLSDLNNEPIKRDVVSKGPVIIEDNVWIGDKVTILPNVTIGKGSVVAANAVVTKSIPQYSIAAGNPAKVIKNFII